MIDAYRIAKTVERWNELAFNNELPEINILIGVKLPESWAWANAVCEPDDPVPYSIEFSSDILRLEHEGAVNLLALHECVHISSNDYTHGPIFQSECRRVAKKLNLEFSEEHFEQWPLQPEEIKFVVASIAALSKLN